MDFNFNALFNASRISVIYLVPNVDGTYVKEFRDKHQLSQIALANILGVTKRKVMKLERSKKKIKGSCAVLLALLNEDDELLKRVYSVKIIDKNSGVS